MKYYFEILSISPKSGDLVFSRHLQADLDKTQVTVEARRFLASAQAAAAFDGEPVLLTCNGEILFSLPKYTGKRVNKL